MPQKVVNRAVSPYILVGTAGFEPATPCPPDKYATRLRYAPNRAAIEAAQRAL